MRTRFRRLILGCLVAGAVHAAELPYRFLLVIQDQWPDPASEVIEAPGEFSMLVALLKNWGLPFDIYRLDQQRFDAYHLLDPAGRPLHGTIIWDAPGATLDEQASTLLRSLVAERGVGLVAFSDTVANPVIAELTGVRADGHYQTKDKPAVAAEHFITRGVTLDERPAASISKLLRNRWPLAVTSGGTNVDASDAAVLMRRDSHPFLTSRERAGRVVWFDPDRKAGELNRQFVRDVFKRALVWVNGYALYAEYPRTVMLSMDDMGAADKTFYPGWHYPTLSEEMIRQHLIAPLQRHHAVMVQNIVPGFVDRQTHRVLNAWQVVRVDEIDPAVTHDFTSTKRGLDAGVAAGVFEIQSHGWTHMPPDLDSAPGPLWPAAPGSPLVQLNWYKEFGDYIRKAEIPASVQRVHLQRGIDAIEAEFGVRPLSLICGGGLSSHSAANNTMRLAAKMGFGFAQPEGNFYLGNDFCALLEPVTPRLQWTYTDALDTAGIPWSVDAPIFLGMHDRDVAMEPASFARLLDSLGAGVRFMTFAEYCGYLHAAVVRAAGGEGLSFTINYDPHYGAFFAGHGSQWTLHVSDETRRLKKLTAEKQLVPVEKGTGRHVIQAK